MPGRKKRHTEEQWARMPDHIVRCTATLRAGTRCRRVAEVGTTVCDMHGGSAPQVQAAAGGLIAGAQLSLAERLLGVTSDPGVPWGIRVKVMQDLLDRGNTVGKTINELHIKVDPAIEILKALQNDPDGFMPAKPVEPAAEHPAIESGEVVQGQVVDHVQEAYDAAADPVPGNVTPLNGWADVDQPQKTVHIDTRIPKDIRDRLPPGA